MEYVPVVDDQNQNIDIDKMTIDPTKRFRHSRQIPTTREEIAGVYTLYPYIDIPSQLTQSQIDDESVRDNTQKLLALQLKYYTDVDYHIKVEITGLSKVSIIVICFLSF
tara:strand:+ start:857 stop:1183 length:327 start_codon:yes stop_codon:yes gene_type:complete